MPKLSCPGNFIRPLMPAVAPAAAGFSQFRPNSRLLNCVYRVVTLIMRAPDAEAADRWPLKSWASASEPVGISRLRAGLSAKELPTE